MIQTRFVMEIAAIASGCFSGVLHAIQRKYDIVGVTVIGISTGIGGGLLRDILIGRGTVLALSHHKYLLVVLSATFLGMFFGTLLHKGNRFIWIVDCLALGFFTVAGIQRALSFDLHYTSAIFLGIVSGAGGGILRDILCRETPAVLLPGEPYSLASFFAGIIYVLSFYIFNFKILICEIIAVGTAFMIKLVSAYFKWNVPPPPDLSRVFKQYLERIKKK